MIKKYPKKYLAELFKLILLYVSLICYDKLTERITIGIDQQQKVLCTVIITLDYTKKSAGQE